ncbi:NTF2-related export protein 1/2 [Geosmithia morbida]|uniref:NTF2-related export protein 1/2 n=1 Tax=Geosmithia morbida TaxID=1094350 RepID=A0A9P4YRF1_9HYPO|nr:NTF2-related export protein 1/2 [Geosmithia morbida]KAF4120700.1 NTF2-related export protein 1/2 [Geosmithia morbida]
MPLPTPDVEIKASSEAAEGLVTRYYEALNNHAPILPFYVNSTSRYTIKADISINGAQVATPADYFNLLEAQGQGVRYEAESLDTHAVNPSFQYDAPTNIANPDKEERNGGRMSTVVTVMGKVQYGKGRDAPRKMFNETFVLVPNWEAMQKNPPRGIRPWLIMSQNFRAL